jgi:DNA repair protein RAD5
VATGELRHTLPSAGDEARGGILADEMVGARIRTADSGDGSLKAACVQGLGKTIEVLALVHSHRGAAAANAGTGTSSLAAAADGRRRSPATLVVCPMSLLGQWRQEAEKSAAADLGLRIVVY